MCGLCGFTGEVIDRDAVIKNMTDVITHRGPDSSGIYSDADISMGFRRLSIIDLDQGSQPIYNEDKSMVLMFNGEIYNYQQLREILIAKGHRFYTKTDSEVLLHGFEEWREDLLNKLRGMFAFAIWNKNEKSLFLARDFFGIKPMHYTQVGGSFVYGSEIKSILEFPGFEKKLNLNALNNYISFEYPVPPETFFENVSCLMPAHYLWYRNGEVEIKRYWEPKFEPDETMTEEQAVDEIDKVFEDSVAAHRISDVEVGCFLSSGVDSSYVATYFTGQKTFTVGFGEDEKYNEIGYAKDLSSQIGVEHHFKTISPDEYWGNIRKVMYHMDQPLADASCIALYFVSKIASEYVKVVLSGEGSDELFGGYNIYHEPDDLAAYRRLPLGLRKALASFVQKLPFSFKGKNFLIRGSKTTEETFIGNNSLFTMAEKRRLLKDGIPATRPQKLTRPWYDRVQGKDDVTKMQYLDINVWMVGDILLKADRMSMANSLELRVPFLDRKVFAVASRVPRRLKVNPQNTKYALRKAALRHLPEATAQKKKLGFPVPIRVWLREEKYGGIVRQAFTSETAGKFFNTDFLTGLLDSHMQGKCDNSRKIWTVFIFLVWYDIYFNGASHEPGELPVVK
ncbi:Asparagine synthetase [glutamine-hydrolyzing] 1 [Caprobacter fermentans]|uniref:asparagine synthase (glutamine-hydrolyzing) n=1 Tax=Caproicibacter fermentans TaxID=2576756 RepID=A0A6N8I2G4_9FIRM|nr:asparagine synthase (glutamine-hydrolyzing) [Caproicibacter fermentans]MVB12159.1 Asparagine synthetase [glutamine-hydrolyzing] 1 [Caproicibacter fermentans]OCN01190.1 asparagine synthase (glutamine-hydrolyzing) [Clostridium sp. W14A]QNK39586.1 asparagine synthase (glutamine-hydrolyzing) [Caproicibacter fermentans]